MRLGEASEPRLEKWVRCLLDGYRCERTVAREQFRLRRQRHDGALEMPDLFGVQFVEINADMRSFCDDLGSVSVERRTEFFQAVSGHILHISEDPEQEG